MLIQNSSASIAIVQLPAMGGAFGTNRQVTLDMAIPFVLGTNIGGLQWDGDGIELKMAPPK